jgi:CRISPR/Cas system-associated exonuclease Cas4 (RecB family)
MKELFVELLRNNHPPKESNVFYITEIVNCPLVSYLEMGPFSFDLIAGTAIHEWLQNKLIRKDNNWKAEYRISWEIDGYVVVGKIDLLNETGKFLVEIKTGNFSPSHVLQLRAYLNKFPDFTGFLVYIQKKRGVAYEDAVKVLRINVPLSLKELALLVDNYITKKGPPSIEFCSYCSMPCKREEGVLDSVWNFEGV